MHVNPAPACLERDLPHNNLHQLPIDLLPARGSLIQGIFNQLLLDIVQLAPRGTVVNFMSPRSPRRIHLEVISPFIQCRQWHPGRLVDLSCGMWIPCDRMHQESIMENDLEVPPEIAIP
jgi:hypothetical protein